MLEFFELSESCKDKHEYIDKVKQELGIDTHYLDKLAEKKGLKMRIGEKNVGNEFDYYQTTTETANISKKRSYKQIPGTYFKKGIPLTSSQKAKYPFVYVNVNADTREYCSFNMYAHELGHAIWDLFDIASNQDFLVLKKSFFNTLYLNVSEDLNTYLNNVEEFFAETYAMYTEKRPLKDIQHHTPISVYVDCHTYLYDYQHSKYLFESYADSELEMSPNKLLCNKAKELFEFYQKLENNF